MRPDRQLLMYSATMKRKIEGFAREMLTDEIRIVVGTIGQANEDIYQVAQIMPDAVAKWHWLTSRIDEFAADGKVLIFVLGKLDTEELAKKLQVCYYMLLYAIICYFGVSLRICLAQYSTVIVYA